MTTACLCALCGALTDVDGRRICSCSVQRAPSSRLEVFTRIYAITGDPVVAARHARELAHDDRTRRAS